MDTITGKTKGFSWKKFLKPTVGKIMFSIFMSVMGYMASPPETPLARVFQFPVLVLFKFVPMPIVESWNFFWDFVVIGVFVFSLLSWYFIYCLFAYLWLRLREK